MVSVEQDGRGRSPVGPQTWAPLGDKESSPFHGDTTLLKKGRAVVVLLGSMEGSWVVVPERRSCSSVLGTALSQGTAPPASAGGELCFCDQIYVDRRCSCLP